MKKSNKFKSKFERNFAKHLRSNAINFEYECDYLEYTKRHRYLPDFKVRGFYIETKGRFLGKDRAKLLEVKKAHPLVEVRLVFMRDQPLYKGSPNKYSDWCKKHGFKYAIKTIPKAWVKEIKDNKYD